MLKATRVFHQVLCLSEAKGMDIIMKIRPVWAEINLDNLAHNIKEIKRITNSKEIMAVVKADAYGHGALECSEVLLENGVNSLAVAVITEAISLRKQGIKAPIMVLGYTPEEYAEEVVEYDIQPAIYDIKSAVRLCEVAERKGKKVRIHVAIDTGMGRIGFLCKEESFQEIEKINNLNNIEIYGLFSHFFSADEEDRRYADDQFEKFMRCCDILYERGIKPKLRHIANSAAVIGMPQMHLDNVRPGIILYGYYPSSAVNHNLISLKPVMEIKARIGCIKLLSKDMYVSYGRTYKTERDTMVAILPIGYADGYSRLLTNKGKVIVNGKLAHIIGRICMDQCMIDVTGNEPINMGDEVTILGGEGDVHWDADDIAKVCGTISYEVLSTIGKRIPRVYIKNNEIVRVKNYI